jgi:hypothetical protein
MLVPADLILVNAPKDRNLFFSKITKLLFKAITWRRNGQVSSLHDSLHALTAISGDMFEVYALSVIYTKVDSSTEGKLAQTMRITKIQEEQNSIN